MADVKNLSPEIILHIAQSLNLPVHSLTAVIGLLNEGGTVPFIARYRKEATGNLDEVQIRDIEEKLAYFRDLVSRRETILASIAEQGKLTDELKDRIEATLDKAELEDLYLPYRPKRRTKATIARERGLRTARRLPLGAAARRTVRSPIRRHLCRSRRRKWPPSTMPSKARATSSPRPSARTPTSARPCASSCSRKAWSSARKPWMRSTSRKNSSMYYDYREPVKTIPSHRMLAIRRGETESVLYFLIELDPLRATALLRAHILRATGDWTPHLELAIDDSWKRLLNPSIQGEVRLELKKRSDADAIQVFRDNLQNLLLAAPAGPLSVLGIDPGLRTGCKVAVVDETGKFLAHDVLYLHTSKNAAAGAGDTLASLIAKHNVRAIAIGNGTASRETDAFVRDFLRERKLERSFLGHRERVRGQRLLRLRHRAPGVSRPRPDRSRRHLHCAPPSGSAVRTGQGRPEIHRRRPVSA